MNNDNALSLSVIASSSVDAPPRLLGYGRVKGVELPAMCISVDYPVPQRKMKLIVTGGEVDIHHIMRCYLRNETAITIAVFTWAEMYFAAVVTQYAADLAEIWGPFLHSDADYHVVKILNDQ